MPSVIWPYSFYTCSSEHWVNYISLGSGSFIKHFCLCELYSSPYSCLWGRVKQADKITRCRNTRVPSQLRRQIWYCVFLPSSVWIQSQLYTHVWVWLLVFYCSRFQRCSHDCNNFIMEQTSVFDVDLLKALAEMLFVKFLILTKVSYKVTNNTKNNQQVVLTH